MFKVYRYETTKDRRGPYNCDFDAVEDWTVCESLHRNHMKDAERTPSVRIDGLDFIVGGDGYKTGCNSIELLRKWFRGYNKWLIKSGFVLAEYTVKEKVDGTSKKQCVFHKSAIIDRVEIPSF